MYEYRAVVRSIYDGDTMRCDIDLGFGVWTANQQLRLIGIDAPEMTTPEGKPARDWLRAALPIGTEVVLITHKDQGDKYGRWLAQVFAPDDAVTSVNQKLIDAGHARAYDGGKR
jgi:micrococcal nuclease